MALLKCAECRGKVSSTANACPHCGAGLEATLVKHQTDSKRQRTLLWVAVVVVGAVMFLGKRGPVPAERLAANDNSGGAEIAQRAVVQKPAADDSFKEVAWIEKGKDAVRAKLKDPGSAQFKDVFFFRGKDNIPITCGQVNSKNSFGGYTGYQHFVSGASPELTFLESEVKDFTKAWNRFCK